MSHELTVLTILLDNCHLLGHLLLLQDTKSFPHCVPGYMYIKIFLSPSDFDLFTSLLR